MSKKLIGGIAQALRELSGEAAYSRVWQRPVRPDKRGIFRVSYVGDRSKYKPHQGAGECERRVRRGW